MLTSVESILKVGEGDGISPYVSLLRGQARGHCKLSKSPLNLHCKRFEELRVESQLR